MEPASDKLADIRYQGWVLSAGMKDDRLRGLLLRDCDEDCFVGPDRTIFSRLKMQNGRFDQLKLVDGMSKSDRERIHEIERDFMGMPGQPQVYLDWIERLTDHRSRRLLRNLLNLQAGTIQPDTKPDDVITQTIQEMTAIRERGGIKGLMGMDTSVKGVETRIDAWKAGQKSYGEIPTGFAKIDGLTGGCARKELTVLAARPKHGKSALAALWGRNAALWIRSQKKDSAVCLFSLEMPRDMIAQRLASAGSGVNEEDIRDDKATSEQEYKYREALRNLAELDDYFKIDDTAAITSTEIYTRCMVEAAQHKDGLALVIVDYGGLLGDPQRKGETTSNRIGRITGNLKRLAMDFNCAVLLLWQLNRECESRPDRRPKLSDLRESGNVEQDAHRVYLLMRPARYMAEQGDKKVYETTVIKNLITELGEDIAALDIAANRSGVDGQTAWLHFTGEYKRFWE